MSLVRETKVKNTSLGIEIRCQTRTAGNKSNTQTLWVGEKQRVSSRGIERTGLTDEECEVAEREYRDEMHGDGSSTGRSSIQYPDWAYRRMRKWPLLMIHLIEIKPGGEGDPPTDPVVAWGISFPKTVKEEKRVEYVVNTTWIHENFGEDIDEDEMDGDHD